MTGVQTCALPISLASLEEAAQCAREVFAYRAAQATPGQLEHIALDKVDEMMIDRDLADLVDDDGCVGECGRDQSAAQERRFAAAEKAGQNCYRDSVQHGCVSRSRHYTKSSGNRFTMRRDLASIAFAALFLTMGGGCILSAASASCLP